MKIEREFDEVEIDIPDLANACVKNYLSGNAILVFLYVLTGTQNDSDYEHFFFYEDVAAALGLNKEELNDAIVELEMIRALSLSRIDYEDRFEGCVCLNFEDWIPNMTKTNFCELINKLASLHITEAEFQIIATVSNNDGGEFPLTTLLRISGIQKQATLDTTLKELANMGILMLNPLGERIDPESNEVIEEFCYQLAINYRFEQWGNLRTHNK